MTPHYSAVPKALFNAEVDSVATSFLKRPDLPATQEANRAYSSALLSIAEALIVAPRVTFKVYGENVVLAVLSRIFGARGVEQLMDEGAAEFVLWRSLIVKPEEKMIKQGLNPLAYGNMSSAEHSDPEASCISGMKWNPNLDRKVRRRLARRAARHMTTTPDDNARLTVEAVLNAYGEGTLKDLGFDPTTPVDALSPAEVDRLQNLANELGESAVLFEREWDLYEGDSSWNAMLKVADEIRSSGRVVNAVEEILRTENLPSIRSLLLSNDLSFEDVLKLRKRTEVREFQEWLWTRPDPADARGVINAYTAAIAKDSKPKLADKTWFQIVRILGVAFVGGGAGAAVGGPAGAAAGTAVGFTVANLGSAGVSYVDLLIDKVARGKTPRRFSSLLRDQQILKG